ncbi:hypothetical protein DFS34DRAFT_639265 [Phlyctochytrium arcticum]|nr:hypothetical protein DFS34DRAFT_639265 [Phlyctochytrium arcticum]
MVTPKISTTSLALNDSPRATFSEATSPRYPSSATKLQSGQSTNQRLKIDETTKKYGSVRVFSLNVVFPTLFGLAFAVVGVVVSLVWAHSQSSLRTEVVGAAQIAFLNTGDTLLQSANDEVMAQLGSFLSTAETLVNTIAELQQPGAVVPLLPDGNFDAYYNFFYRSILVNPFLTGITYVDVEKNTYLSFDREDSGNFQIELMLNSNATCNVCGIAGGATPPNNKYFYPVSPAGVVSASSSRFFSNYYVKTRSWFQSAVKANKTVWTNFTPHSIGGVGGVGCAKPFYSKTRPGEIAGVFMVDILLQPLSLFLKSVTDKTGGFAYVMDPTGGLLASSALEPVSYVPAGGTSAVQTKAINSTNEFTRSTSPKVLEKVSAAAQTETFRGDDYWYKFSTFYLNSGTNSIAVFPGLVIAGRESTYYTATATEMSEHFTSYMVRAVRNSALITAALIIVGFVAILPVAYYFIIKPLKQLENGMLKVIKSAWPKKCAVS